MSRLLLALILPTLMSCANLRHHSIIKETMDDRHREMRVNMANRFR